MNYVNCGNYKTSYESDMALFQTGFSRTMIVGFILLLYVAPAALDEYLIYIGVSIFIAVIGAVGLNLLTGFTGLISLGQGAFIGVGAYATGYLANTFPAVPFFVIMPVAGLITAMVGATFGIPSLRLKGLYLSIATLAAQFILEFVFIRATPITGGSEGLFLDYANVFGFYFDTDFKFYYLALTVCVLMTLGATNIARSRIGRAFLSVRDNYIAAGAMGINVFKYKLISFAISSFFAGMAGSLWAYYLTIITPEHFTIGVSIQYLSMIIIGGLGKVLGAVFGAIFITILPEALRYAADFAGTFFPAVTGLFAAIREAVFGIVIIVFLVFEPEGLVHRWNLIKAYWKLWPFSY